MGKQHYKNGRAFYKPYECLSCQQRWRRKLRERQQDLNRPDKEPSCSTSTVNIRTNDLIREDIPCVASDEVLKSTVKAAVMNVLKYTMIAAVMNQKL